MQQILERGGQGGAFIKAAREFETDKDEEAFKKRLVKVAKAPPPSEINQSKKKPAK